MNDTVKFMFIVQTAMYHYDMYVKVAYDIFDNKRRYDDDDDNGKIGDARGARGRGISPQKSVNCRIPEEPGNACKLRALPEGPYGGEWHGTELSE